MQQASGSPSWDLIVVGGGPAGSFAAHLAAEAGIKVLLLEKDETPGDSNVCAGGIPPEMAEELRLDDEMVEKRIFGGIHHFPWGKMELRRKQPVHICVKRPKLDAFLASRAEHSGTTLVTSTRVIDIREREGSIDVEAQRAGSPAEFTGRLVILADGVNTLARKRQGLGFERDRRATAVSFASEFELPCETMDSLDMLELFYDPAISPFGYGWIFPKRQSVNVGLGILLSRMSSPFARYKGAFMGHPRVASLLEDATKVWSGSALIPARSANPMFRGRLLVAGDAAGLVHAFWGAGNQHAALSGKLAAEAAIDAMSRDADLEAGPLYQEKWGETSNHSELQRAWKICSIAQRFSPIDPNVFPKAVFGMLAGKLALMMKPRILLYPMLGH